MRGLLGHAFASRHLVQPRHVRCLRAAASSADQQQASSGSAPPAPSSGNQKGGKAGKNAGKGAKPAVAESSIEQLRAIRIGKVQTLREGGHNPFAYRFERTAHAQELQEQYAGLANGEEAPEDVCVAVAGRVMLRRVMGKLAFVTLRDDTGSIQLYVDKSRLDNGEAQFDQLKNLIDAGDIVGVSGGLRRTDKGELSVVAKNIEVLTKSLLPLPDKWHGLQDVEKRYRQRYLDLIVNPEVKATFLARSRIVSTIRACLEDRGFCEVETPVLEAVAGGADARPFTTYHNTLKRTFTMRIATELHLKRLVVGGFERVFEIGRIFRNEGISTRHNPEFTSIELYQAYADYFDMMDLTELLIRRCAERVNSSFVVQYGEALEIDFAQPFRRASMHALVKEVTGVDFWALRHDADACRSAALDALERGGGSAKDKGAVAGSSSPGRIVNALFEALVEPTLQQPTFVCDHPVEISPLAKPHREHEGLVERFELFVAGRELANSFSELTDPVEQRSRLEKQVADHRAARALRTDEEKEADPEMDYDVELDEDFLTALEYGMPPTGGMGMGIDRLVMLLTNSHSIRDVIAFPSMK